MVSIIRSEFPRDKVFIRLPQQPQKDLQVICLNAKAPTMLPTPLRRRQYDADAQWNRHPWELLPLPHTAPEKSLNQVLQTESRALVTEFWVFPSESSSLWMNPKFLCPNSVPFWLNPQSFWLNVESFSRNCESLWLSRESFGLNPEFFGPEGPKVPSRHLR